MSYNKACLFVASVVTTRAMSYPVAVRFEKSSRSNKKLMAIFTLDNGTTKVVHFGAAGMSDYTIHKDDERKQRYLSRHHGNENWNDPMTPGALSRWILWNMKSVRASVADYKTRFGLR